MSNPRGNSRHEQIRDYVLLQITTGAWPEGFQVPTEVELGKQFSASKMTVHYAMKALRDKGYIRRTRGLGTFVTSPSRYVTCLPQIDIVQQVQGRSGDYTVRILERCVRTASPAEVAIFRLQPGASLFHIRLLHSENGLPIQLEDRLVNMAVAPGLLEQDVERETPFSYLMRLRPRRDGQETIRARPPQNDEHILLQLSAGESCLEIERVTWTEREVVTTVNLIHPASRFMLQGRIESQDSSA